MKAELDPKTRNTRAVLTQEKNRLREELISVIDLSLVPLSERIKEEHSKDLEFRESAKEIINQLVPGVTKIKCKTTGGPQDSILREYEGTFTKNHGHGLFNMADEQGEFTIGLSSLCYIEIINQ